MGGDQGSGLNVVNGRAEKDQGKDLDSLSVCPPSPCSPPHSRNFSSSTFPNLTVTPVSRQANGPPRTTSVGAGVRGFGSPSSAIGEDTDMVVDTTSAWGRVSGEAVAIGIEPVSGFTVMKRVVQEE